MLIAYDLLCHIACVAHAALLHWMQRTHITSQSVINDMQHAYMYISMHVASIAHTPTGAYAHGNDEYVCARKSSLP